MARILTQLMKNHSRAVTASLMERTVLIQSVIWLSHHVPGCVLKHLFDTILRKRYAVKDKNTYEMASADMDTNFGSSPEFSYDNYDVQHAQHLSDTPIIPVHDLSLPIVKTHESALLFVDMSGFTKISTILDVESLSNAINSYFQLIVNEVTSHGGDILKFAGDAIFAEWKASRTKSGQSIEYCVVKAAECASSIVANCSDYPIYSKPAGISRASIRLENVRPMSARNLRGSVKSAPDQCRRKASITSEDSSNDGTLPRRSSIDHAPIQKRFVGHSPKPIKLATLNVKCGVGVGKIVGVHVGNDAGRREYLILGSPIDQVAAAEGAATTGEVFASPEALKVLSRVL
jgi:class 3 adenylate cyclase